MRYTNLGRTGFSVSVLALGCWSFGGGPYWGDRDEADSIRTVKGALDEGINFFDTAEMYGDGYTEILLGKGLAGRRQQAIIASKVSAAHLAYDEVHKACEASLSRLNTDYIDLYQIHWPNRDVPIAETMAALESLKSQGKIRAIGVSNFGVGDLRDVMAVGRIESDQLPYSLIWRAIEYEVLPECRKHDVGVLCYSPLAQGLLSGNYSCADDVPEGRACTRHFADSRPGTRHGEPGCEIETFNAVSAIKAIADEEAVPMANLSLAWLLAQPGITAAIVGARNPTQLRSNVQATELALDGVATRLSEVTAALREKFGPNPDMWQSDSRYR
ncbi:MAG: aldo/keto reductase [Anaerolineae bacterium]